MLKWLPENVSTFGGDVDFVIYLIFYVVGAWFLLAFGLLLFFCIVYREKEGRRAAYVPGRSMKVLSFVLIPTALVLCFDLAIDSASHKTWDKVKRDIPEGDITIGIRGKQFAWTFVYPGPDGELGTADDLESLNNLFVPVNKVVRFELTSEDVIHSFFLPNARLKQDAVPGRTIPGWFEITKKGRYQVACAELCGNSHTSMRGWMTVLDQNEFEAEIEKLAEYQQEAE